MTVQPEDNSWVEEVWRIYLTTGEPPGFDEKYAFKFKDLRWFMRHLPRDPRCTICHAPFEGLGGTIMRLGLGRNRSKLNPQMCNICEQFASKYQGGAEIELSMLFADIRGSTTLAEQMGAAEFSELINRFYRATTGVLVHANALIEKMIGDEVAGLFVPGFAGPSHAGVAIEAALEILRVTGHDSQSGPWVPVGVGVHTGVAFVGSVGSEEGMTVITALGDAVNTAARLASQAGPGELVVSETAWSQSPRDADDGEQRELQLKGRRDPVKVHVLRLKER